MDEPDDIVFIEQLTAIVHQWIELGNVIENMPDIPNVRLVKILPPACIALILTHSIEDCVLNNLWQC